MGCWFRAYCFGFSALDVPYSLIRVLWFRVSGLGFFVQGVRFRAGGALVWSPGVWGALGYGPVFGVQGEVLAARQPKPYLDSACPVFPQVSFQEPCCEDET